MTNLRNLKKKGFKYVCGVDEAGRGPLAGPLSLSFFCVSIDEYKKVLGPILKSGLNDSKKIKEAKREELFREVQPHCLNSMISASQIDKKGIAKCYQILIKRMLDKTPKKTYFFLDGAIKFPKEIPHEVIIGGDGIEPTIMVASIVSKVKRDRKMKLISKKCLEYDFETNKGYGTKKHREAIKKYGLSPEHRRSFCKAFTK